MKLPGPAYRQALNLAWYRAGRDPAQGATRAGHMLVNKEPNMFCQNCGAFDTEEAKFCSLCGESLSEVPARKRFPHLRIWKSGAFLEGLNFFRVLLDFSFHQSFSKKIGVLYKLSIFSAALFALLFVLMGFWTSRRFELFTFLMIAFLAFLFMVTWCRIILEVVSVISRMETHKTPVGEKLESRHQIEWNIER